jgi:hypothetical protein
VQDRAASVRRWVGNFREIAPVRLLMRRPWKSLAVPLAAAFALALAMGCSHSGPDEAVTTTETARPEKAAENLTRDASIYAAVIKQLVKDHGRGQGKRPFKVILVVDGVVPHAERPTNPTNPEQPFEHDVADGIRFLSVLADLPPIEFIPDRKSGIVGTSGGSQPGHAKDGGAIISLGAIDGAGAHVEVGSNIWVNGLSGWWLTYVVEHKADVWRVTGMTGPIAIS